MSLLGKHLGRMLSLLFTPPYEDWRIFMVSIKVSLRLRSQRGKNLRTWMIYDLDMKSLLLPLLLLLWDRPLRNSSCFFKNEFFHIIDLGVMLLFISRHSGIVKWQQNILIFNFTWIKSREKCLLLNENFPYLVRK